MLPLEPKAEGEKQAQMARMEAGKSIKEAVGDRWEPDKSFLFLIIAESGVWVNKCQQVDRGGPSISCLPLCFCSYAFLLYEEKEIQFKY